MSTSSIICIRDGHDEMFLYRHNDSFPSVIKDDLSKILDKVKSGEYRDNVRQLIGHIIILGSKVDYLYDWKASIYEPISGESTNITTDYSYVMELDKLKIHCYDPAFKKSLYLLYEA